MKKVLIITYYWPPSGGAGVQRWVKLSKYLVELGVDVYVLTVDEKKASYTSIDNSLIRDVNKKIKVFRTNSFEIINYYSILAGKKNIPQAGFANVDTKSFKQKIVNFIRSNFFIPDPRRGWNKYAINKAKEIIDHYGITTVITSSPPHSTQLIGYRLKKSKNINWIVDLRDPWTDIYYYRFLNHSYVSNAINKMYERNVLIHADKILTVSKNLEEIFIGKSASIDPTKVIQLPNGFDPEDFQNRKLSNEDNYFTVCYAGTMSSIYHPEMIFNAISKLIEEGNIEKIRLKIVGSISEDIQNNIKKLNLANICDYIDTVPHEKVIDYLLNAKLLLLIIPDVDNSEGIVTGKLFEYLASKKRILCLGPKNGDAAKIIKKCNAGSTFERNEVYQIQEFIKTTYNAFIDGKLSENENENVDEYNRKNQAKLVYNLI